MKFLSKFPGWQASLPVFSLILFIVYSFTTYRMLFQIPSWLYSHSKADIFFLASYVFAFAFIECTMLFLFILLMNLILPSQFFRAHFIAQGSLVVTAFTFWALILKLYARGYEFNDLREPFEWLLIFALSLVVTLLAASILMKRHQRIEELIESIGDRMVIFTWIYAPVGLVSLLIVLVRNII
jgi:hypothetical protein